MIQKFRNEIPGSSLRILSRGLLQLHFRSASEIFGKIEIPLREAVTASQTGYYLPQLFSHLKSVCTWATIAG